TSYDVATHYRDEVVPLRKTISDELLLRYNGMLASVFELLTDAREQVGAVNGYIDALKDYWLAETDLQMAVGGRLPSSGAAPRLTNSAASAPESTPKADAAPQPASTPAAQPAPATQTHPEGH
ncbi:MAG: RND transporter, partial [Burkholderia sp.]|nr:RND transporter [Burkholderia sp.]